MKYSIKNSYIIQSQEPSLHSRLKGYTTVTCHPQPLVTTWFMTSVHFISIQRRNSCIRSMTELIITLSPETMDFSIESGHSYHVAKVRKAMEHAGKEVGL
jgi:hypothetical protein